jgi:hypothetical protein
MIAVTAAIAATTTGAAHTFFTSIINDRVSRIGMWTMYNVKVYPARVCIKTAALPKTNLSSGPRFFAPTKCNAKTSPR